MFCLRVQGQSPFEQLSSSEMIQNRSHDSRQAVAVCTIMTKLGGGGEQVRRTPQKRRSCLAISCVFVQYKIARNSQFCKQVTSVSQINYSNFICSTTKIHLHHNGSFPTGVHFQLMRIFFFLSTHTKKCANVAINVGVLVIEFTALVTCVSEHPVAEYDCSWFLPA